MALSSPSPTRVRQLWGHMGSDPERLDATILDAWLAAERLPSFSVAWRELMAKSFTMTGVRRASALPTAELGRLRCPTLLVWGKADPFGAPALGERIARAANAKLVLVEGGHLPWVDDPLGCSSTVGEFLRHADERAPSASAEQAGRPRC